MKLQKVRLFAQEGRATQHFLVTIGFFLRFLSGAMQTTRQMQLLKGKSCEFCPVSGYSASCPPSYWIFIKPLHKRVMTSPPVMTSPKAWHTFGAPGGPKIRTSQQSGSALASARFLSAEQTLPPGFHFLVILFLNLPKSTEFPPLFWTLSANMFVGSHKICSDPWVCFV